MLARSVGINGRALAVSSDMFVAPHREYTSLSLSRSIYFELRGPRLGNPTADCCIGTNRMQRTHLFVY